MDFQKLLLDAGRALSQDEIKALAFLCTDLLGRSLSSVEEASDLFSLLADQDHLSAERPQLLTELLLIIQRTRLIRNLGLSDQAPTRSLISPYRKLLYNLSEEITDDDLRDMKFLLNKNLPRRKLEEKSTLSVFLEMEHMDLISDTNLTLLEEIIGSVCPMLNEKITKFKAQQVTPTSSTVQETARPRSSSCTFEPNPAPRSLDPKRSASFEIPEFPPLAESIMNTSNTSMDVPNVCLGVDERDRLSQQLRSLNTDRNINVLQSNLGIDAVQMSPAQTPNTNNEVLGSYRMNRAKRGFCLIINNHDFAKSRPSLKDRKGTEIDEDCLKKVFEWLGFEVEIQSDCTRQKMLSLMQDLGSRDHSQMDCLVCCFLSHGLQGQVFGVDGKTVEIEELKRPVNGMKCTTLAEKPKLFFIQACQGNNDQRPVYIESDGPVCSDAVRFASIPFDADFLLGMATVPSYVSFRERTCGTWFIQSLCRNLVQMVPSHYDLLSILTKVNDDVSQKTDSSGQKKQMPQPSTTLRKRVVFPVPEAPPPSLPPDA
ncbi:caspase-8 isoform X1 [Centropristis striata]|uniref:caspase-8 isoform X1 n=1 Tax=Centropristis striata TaxID=184440 RepID=UPI0027E0FDD1|nr:caspase-8 isoform X1 [Centropristis striata]